MSMQRQLTVLINNIAFTKKSHNINQKVQHSIRENIKNLSLLEIYLEKGQKDEAVHLLENIVELFLRSNVDINIKYEAFYTIAAILLKYLNQWGLTDSLEEDMYINNLFIYLNKNQWEIILVTFNKLINHIFIKKHKDFIDSSDKVVKLVEAYIEKNLAGDISLKKIAEIVHFNPSYLSRLYKNITGNSLSDFICEVKILKAKKLLSDNNYKIYEVASSIGFDNPSYFAKYFKKYTGQTPQDFRFSQREDISLIAL